MHKGYSKDQRNLAFINSCCFEQVSIHSLQDFYYLRFTTHLNWAARTHVQAPSCTYGSLLICSPALEELFAGLLFLSIVGGTSEHCYRHADGCWKEVVAQVGWTMLVFSIWSNLKQRQVVNHERSWYAVHWSTIVLDRQNTSHLISRMCFWIWLSIA